MRSCACTVVMDDASVNMLTNDAKRLIIILLSPGILSSWLVMRLLVRFLKFDILKQLV